MKKPFFRKIIATSIISLLLIQVVYLAAEPTVVGAVDAPDTVLVTLNVTAGISISNGADSTMLPNIGVAGDRSVGSSSWNVITNSTGGYNLAVTASASPALVRGGGGDNFADYTEATPGTPDLWSITSGTKEFGFSAYGTDVIAGRYGNSIDCGNTSTGVTHASAKYEGFSSSTPITISTKATVTPVAGIVTNVCFAAEQSAVYAQNGNYTATITGTATTQ